MDEYDRMRELLVQVYNTLVAWQQVIANSNECGYGEGCLEQIWYLRDALSELGIEVNE
jgi:hypothetical protein